MQARLMNLYFTLQNLMRQDEGQDLIEYALVVALIALAATAGMNTVANDINVAFTSIGTKLTTYTS
jgi:pilus assembly protein Flp/PilA